MNSFSGWLRIWLLVILAGCASSSREEGIGDSGDTGSDGTTPSESGGDGDTDMDADGDSATLGDMDTNSDSDSDREGDTQDETGTVSASAPETERLTDDATASESNNFATTKTATETETATGTDTETATATVTETATSTGSATSTATVTETATSTGSATATATVTETATATATATATVSETATATATASATATATAFATATATASATATATASATATATASESATETDTGTGMDPADCPPAPADATPAQAAALLAVNTLRVPAGAGCATMIEAINTAAQNHCDYYTLNSGACTANAHYEVETCDGFTGVTHGSRMTAAGYSGSPTWEVMTFINDPERAVATWADSVWHRIPLLSPWNTHLGYGGGAGCDTMDFGRGDPMPADTVVVYPYDGQTEVLPSFNGAYEGPEPPVPSTGWESGPPITVYARGIAVTEHLLTRADTPGTPIPHVWLTPGDDGGTGFLNDEVFLYAEDPLDEQTSYRVRITGTFDHGNLNLDWTFTTGEDPSPW